MIKLCYFAGLREQIGKDEEHAPLSSVTVKGLLEWFETTYPHVTTDHLMVAINEEYSTLEDVIEEGDVVALLPPVSGG